MARVVVLGSSNTDLCVRLPKLPARGETVLGGPYWSGPGGKGANQAVAARRAGAEVVFLTAVGDDAFGRAALERYRAEGIDVSHARVAEGVASGVALIFVGEAGENMIGVAPGANARLTPEDIDALPDAVFDPSAVLLASLEVPLETVERALRRARGCAMTTILNPAPAHPEWAAAVQADTRFHSRVWRSDPLHFVDVLTPNKAEFLALVNHPIGTLAMSCTLAIELHGFFGIHHVIVTRGEAGAVVSSRGEMEMLEIPPFDVDVVDTVGAGDAFNGALAVALAERRPLAEAVSWASAAGALAVTRPGAQGASPSRAEIDRLAARARPPERYIDGA